ncbi:molybdopterin converting factor subunit 1 [Roseomonas sp. CCTCC AB2023176]|uniref:molybdopterin converting factor subunit 1 n=1 Tax=Roseomonas sp. CCTCC AB2023176 TaxID=3342640 RepID=UPI0035DC243D
MRVLYFAWLRQRVGRAEEEVSLPEGVADIGGLMRWLSASSPGHAAAFADPAQVRMAVNQDFCGAEHPVGDGDEVAFFPPVTGG